MQPTLIRTLCLKKGVLFERFFIGNPEVVNHGGFNITEMLINTVCDTLDITREGLRQRLTGGSFDGQYIYLNVMKHLSEALSLPLKYMKDSITHDAAHRLELSCQDAKQGKNDSKGNCIVSKANWLIQLDSLLQFIMSHFRYGHNHTQLHNIARENNEVFLEFNLFSEIRFVEHSYRTYDHFVRMFHLLYEKLKRDEAARERSDKAIHLQNTLVVVETVLDLIFMRDLSHLLTYCSNEFQRFDVLPFYPMDVAEKVLIAHH